MLKNFASVLLTLAISLLVGGCSEEQEPTPEEKWGVDIQSVRTMIFRDGTVVRALNEFRMNSGRYPTTDEGLKSLLRRPKGLDSKEWRGPYLESEEDFTDKWGNEIRYACPGKTYPDDPKKFDLWSLGPDSTEGTDDDILNHNINK